MIMVTAKEMSDFLFLFVCLVLLFIRITSSFCIPSQWIGLHKKAIYIVNGTFKLYYVNGVFWDF